MPLPISANGINSPSPLRLACLAFALGLAALATDASAATSVIQFETAAAVVEKGDTAYVTVLRTGGTDAVTIPFTVGGTAVPSHPNPNLPSDYILDLPADKVVRFGPGIGQQSIIFSISTELAPGANKTIIVTLGTPTGDATVGAPSVETLTIDQQLPITGGKTFVAVPQSPGQIWTFSFTQTSKAAGLSAVVQASPNAVNWSNLPGGAMTRSTATPTLWTLGTTNIPNGSHFFRAVSSAPGFIDTPSPAPWFSNFLAATTALKAVTKSPPKSGQQWTFSATQPGTASHLSVRFQSTTTQTDEGSWTDLPQYSATTRKGSVWTSVTYNVPAGMQYFRAIAAAPGWVDSISRPPYAPVTVQASALVLPDITGFTIIHPGTVHAGDALAFIATQAVVTGVSLRFQTKLSSETNEFNWTDLPLSGTLSHVKDKWTLTTSLVPMGDRDFRAIASAKGYPDVVSITQSLSIGGPRPPQTPTVFTDFILPADNNRVFSTGEIIDVKIGVTDANDLQTVKLQFAAAKKPFTDAGSGQLVSSNLDGIYENHTLAFLTPGIYTVRVAAIDNFSPGSAATNYSATITLTVGAGGGTTPPVFGTFANSLIQSTLKARGSVKISVPIGDDRQVYKAFLFRAQSDGTLLSLAGEMPAATTGNQAVRSFTDLSLSDGVYYYTVLASDFDGNISASTLQGPFTLTTPLPPPPPITLTVTPESLLVNSTHPPSGNHPDMPQPDQGTVHFTWSGLAKGNNLIVGHRVDQWPGTRFFSKTTTATSGELTVPAPTLYGVGQGETNYVIEIFPGGGGEPYTLTPNSRNWFTVGHSWNIPGTFTNLDFGLYWFKDVRNGLRALGAGQNDQYFDPNKPTIIYVHGWQANEAGVRRRECWQRLNPNDGKTKYDLCAIWKDRGYNVGLFYWNQFAWEDGIFSGLYQSEAKIYGTRGPAAPYLPAGQGMTYALYDPTTAARHAGFLGNEGILHEVIYYDPDLVGDRSVCDLFYADMVRCLAGYDTGSHELRIIGHSLGTQVIGRTMELINQSQPQLAPLPNRIALLDLAQTSTETLPPPFTGSTVAGLQKLFLDDLASAGVAIESYQSTDLQSFIGVLGARVKPVYDLTAYARIRPDWILPVNLPASHGEAIRWYSESFGFEEFPTYSYWAPFVIRDWIGYGISASTSTARIRSLMGGQLYFNQTEGKGSADLSDDGFEQLYDRN